MAEKNRSSRLAIVEETVPGTYEAPGAGTDFIALQEGFRFSPNFDQLENAELKSSIGVGKGILGLERPDGDFAHYLRASGVEGQAPGYGLLLEGIFGSYSANATERSTTTGSTVSVVNLAAGGTDFARGKAILLKTATYQVRPVLSVSTNALTLLFDLDSAPGNSIACGKCVNYAPADEGHPQLSLTLYRGNGGAVEALERTQVVSLDVSIAAGQIINATFGFQASRYMLNPLTVDATNNKLNFTDDDGTVTATITSGTYRTPTELAAAITSAMNAANGAQTATCVYQNSDGKFKITSTGTVLSLLWKTGTNGSDNTDTHIGTLIGFSDAADDTGTAATTGYTSDNALDLSSPYTPTFDSADPQVAKNNEVFIGDNDDITCFCASTVDISFSLEIQDVECVCAESGVQEKIPNRRSVTIDIVGILERYDVSKFDKFQANDDVRFSYTFGSKSGGNWVPGTVCNINAPSATISAHELGDNNGLATMAIQIKPYVDDNGNGEFYMNFL